MEGVAEVKAIASEQNNHMQKSKTEGTSPDIPKMPSTDVVSRWSSESSEERRDISQNEDYGEGQHGREKQLVGQ